MRFVHIADVHLGMSFKTASFGKAFGQKKREGIKKNLRNVITYIKDKKIELLLIAGDFLEGDYVELTDLYDIKYMFDLIPTVKVVIMAGNHDPLLVRSSPYTLIEWPPNVTLVKTGYSCYDFEELDTSVISISWDSKGPMSLNKEKLNQSIQLAKHTSKIVMLHGDCYLPNDYFYMETKYLKSLNVDYIALGHIHKHDIMENHIVYPGSLEPLDFSENYPHGYINGELNDHKLNIEFIPSMINPMDVVDVDISTCQSYLEMVDVVKETLESHEGINDQSMVRVLLNGEKSPYIGEISKDFIQELKDMNQNRISYIEVKDKTVLGYDIEVLYEEHKDDLIGYFIRSIKEEGMDDEVNQKALNKGIAMLLEAMG